MLAQVPGLDPATLPLRPFEGYVLSRIDGTTGLEELAQMVGRPVPELRPLVERLIALGAVRWAERPPRSSRVPRGRPRVATSPPPPEGEARLYDPAELDEDVDLPPELRRQVLDLYYRLDALDHYALLGVPRDADKAAIRKAYFERSKRFHPDTFFGKDLGSYKQKLQVIFDRLTKAYETLSKRKKREAYDRYLGSFDATRQASALLARGEGFAASRSGASEASPGARTPSARPTPRSAEEVARLKRRRAMARLGGALGKGALDQMARGSQRRGGAGRPSAAQAARRLEASLGRKVRGAAGEQEAWRRERERLLAEARAAASEGRWVVALEKAQRLSALLPDDEDVLEMVRRARRHVAAQLAADYEKRARYEEENGQWALAAVSWARVHEGRPGEAEPAWRAARCLVEAGGDLKRAKALATEAIGRQPDSAEAHLVLGRVYLAAGLHLNARRELQRARELGARDPRLAVWLAQAERAEGGKPASG